MTYDFEDADENTVEITVSVSDGTLSDSYAFDLIKTTNKAAANGDHEDVEVIPADADVDGSVETYVVTLTPPEVRIDQRGVVIGDVADYIMQAVDPLSLNYDLVEPVSPLRLGTGAQNGKIVMDYVPSPAPGEETLDYTIVVTIDDGYADVEVDGDKVPDLTLTIKITITVEPLPDQAFPVAEVDIDENEIGVVLPADHAALVGLIGDEVVEVTHAGGTGAGVTGSGNFGLDTATGEVTLDVPQDFEVDGANHTVTLRVERTRDSILLGTVTVLITVNDVNEAPSITTSDASAFISEDAQKDDVVQTGDLESDGDYQLAATDPEDDGITFRIDGKVSPFVISSDNKLVVRANDLFDYNLATSYDIEIIASDGKVDSAPLKVAVEVGNANDAPQFQNAILEITIPENKPVGDEIALYTATDADKHALKYTLKDQDDTNHFALDENSGSLTIASGLDYETQQVYLVEINVTDPIEASDEIQLKVNVTNVNDNGPTFNVMPPVSSVQVAENTARDHLLANFAATDLDGDTVKYTVDNKSFRIDGDGNLVTLESLDFDSATPCPTGGCVVNVYADDMPDAESGAVTAEHKGRAEATVRISVTAAEDSVSTLDVLKANPVPGPGMGIVDSSLAGTKKVHESQNQKSSPAVPERPGDMPAISYMANIDDDPELETIYPAGPVNFVETDWASWGTVLRIEIVAESPDAGCGNGNQCVVIDVNSDSADTSIKLEAYRSATQENKFIAALMLVEKDEDATDSASAEYRHSDGSVARLKVDEEDEIEIEFYNLRGSVDVENESPEISNFAPEHEAAFDDADVDYTFTVTDGLSGLPEPEDLPDTDMDADYTAVVALISRDQCETLPGTAAYGTTDDGDTLNKVAQVGGGESLYCPGKIQPGEFDAKGHGYGFAPIRDDRDFDEIDDGFDVETTIVLDENKTYYLTFIACDRAGNCAFYDPDGNDDTVELAEITVDIDEPKFVEARTGLTWDSTDNEYGDDKSFIQVLFNDLTNLNIATVEIDDFVVEGHTIKDVHIFENPDDDDVDWGDSDRYARVGNKNLRGIDRYRDLENAVFLELEDELLADETPDVAIVPNGVEDKAGNEQDDGDNEADDWISPSFTIVSMVSTLETSQDEILAGDGDEVTVVVTSDERLESTRPTVWVTYVNAPAGTIDTKGIATCDDKGDNDGTRDRGEIVHTGDCADSDAATGGNLTNNVEKVSNTEWVVTITEPKDTGYYNFRIEGRDRSPENNPGSEGVSPGAIVKDFFDADGDVNADDAIFYEGDINLPKPQVRVSGVGVEDNEADVEFRSPLFVELDFAERHSVNCTNVDADEEMANCMNENSEYAEDNFDDVVVTSFMLDGVDITDSVKTTDNQSFLISLESISIGDHTATVQAVDQAGNVFEDTLEIDFEVNDRDPFEKRLSPGWNLVSLPGEPADSSIGSVFGPGVEVRTVYSYDPVIPGGWQVAVRETLDSDWQGDLTEINGQHGYWVLSDAIQDWEVSIPRLAGGSAGTGTPIQPPVIPLYAGWNLIPVTDISGNGSGGDRVSARVYLQSLEAGVEAARVLGFDTISNQWETVLDPDMQMNNTLTIGWLVTGYS